MSLLSSYSTIAFGVHAVSEASHSVMVSGQHLKQVFLSNSWFERVAPETVHGQFVTLPQNILGCARANKGLENSVSPLDVDSLSWPGLQGAAVPDAVFADTTYLLDTAWLAASFHDVARVRAEMLM